METIRTLLVATLFLTSLTVWGQQTRWTDFENAWNNYLSKPTDDNAEKAYRLLPDKILSGDYPNGGITGRILSKIDQLNNLVQQRNRYALRLAFKLFTIADGEYAEGLQIEIGKLISIDTKLFLQELKNHKQLIISLDGLVGNLGQDYVDRPELQKKEKENRIRSLKKISDRDLVAVRDECLTQLNRQIKKT
ncbi:MAG: hypothetical protein U0U09_12400 [Cyclobacteriaceae bacterium]